MADPQMETVLAGLTQAFAASEGPVTPELFRKGLREVARLLDNRDIPVGKIENRTIGGAQGELGARIYTPIAAGASMLPTLVFFHGGGFVAGSIDTHDTLCRGLTARSGCKVISVDYRLAPEHSFPAAIEDGYAAVRWIEANAPALGVDSNSIAVGGDSAGGNIAAVTALMARAAGSPVIRFQLLIYPVTQWSETPSRQQFAEDPIIPRAAIDALASYYFGPMIPNQDFRAAPANASDFGGLPPAYVVTAGLDPLRDEGAQYAEQLRAAGVAVEHVRYDDMIHGFMMMSAVLDTAKLAIERAGDALRAATWS